MGRRSSVPRSVCLCSGGCFLLDNAVLWRFCLFGHPELRQTVFQMELDAVPSPGGFVGLSGLSVSAGGVERRTRCMALTSCFPCPYNFLTMCYMPIIDSKLRRGAVLGLLLFAYHTLTNCSPRPYNFLTICYMPRIDSKMRGGAVLGVLLFAYHTLTACSPCPYNVLTICYMPRIDSKLRGEPFWGCCCLRTMS